MLLTDLTMKKDILILEKDIPLLDNIITVVLLTE